MANYDLSTHDSEALFECFTQNTKKCSEKICVYTERRLGLRDLRRFSMHARPAAGDIILGSVYTTKV